MRHSLNSCNTDSFDIYRKSIAFESVNQFSLIFSCAIIYYRARNIYNEQTGQGKRKETEMPADHIGQGNTSNMSIYTYIIVLTKKAGNLI